MMSTLAPLLVVPSGTDRETWLEARRSCVGASDVAPILGISPYQGPLHVWLDKTGQLNWPGNNYTKWGSRFEDDVLEEFIEQHPELIVTASPGMYADPADPWKSASLDAEAIGEDGLEVVEIKTTQMRRTEELDGWGEPGTDEIPLHYLCQVTWQCAVRQAGRWRLAVLALDNLDDYREYCGVFSPVLGAQLHQRVGAWRTIHIIGGVEPAADGFEDTTEILTGRRAARALAKKGEIDADAVLWQAGYKANHDAINEFGRVKDEYGNLLRQALLAAGVEIGTVGGIEVTTWKQDKNGKPMFRVKGV